MKTHNNICQKKKRLCYDECDKNVAGDEWMMLKPLEEKGVGSGLVQCRAMFDAAGDMIALTDGFRILDANRPFVDFFSKKGMGVFEEGFVFPEQMERIDKYGYVYDGYREKTWIENILIGDKEHYRIGMKQGGEVLSFNIAVKSMQGFKGIYTVTLTDITPMMGYKDTLEKERRTTRFLLEQYDRAIDRSTLMLKGDINGTITYANDSFCRIMKYRCDELIGKNVTIFQGPSKEKGHLETVAECIRKGEMYRGAVENVDKEGAVHYFDLSIVPIADTEGNVIEFLSIRHEITDLIEAREAAIRTLEAKTKFFDQASHELRTPLNAVLNFTDQAIEMFEDGPQDPTSLEMIHLFLRRTHKNAKHLLRLIDSLLSVARLRSGKEKYAISFAEVCAIAQEVYESTVSLNRNMAVNYHFIRCSEEIWIECDPIKMRQILTNLVSNALKFTQEGSVKMEVNRIGDVCRIEVSDTGIGIPPEKIERIFEPFEQVHAHDQGTGLGLAIVREYAKAMGMTLEVVSEYGKGSCFTLTAPLKIQSRKEKE